MFTVILSVFKRFKSDHIIAVRADQQQATQNNGRSQKCPLWFKCVSKHKSNIVLLSTLINSNEYLFSAFG